MPIANGRCGHPGALAIPGDRFLRLITIRTHPLSNRGPVTVTGVTKNAAGTALGGCLVAIYATPTNAVIETGVSDGSGNYTLSANVSGPYYVVAYLAGAPDVEGTTVNTLVGV